MPPGMLHGALAVSPIAVGTLDAIDISAAKAEPGVIEVFTHETIPDYKTPKGFYAGGPGTASFWPMTGTEIRYAGQPVAFVVAESAAAARRGADLVKASYSKKTAHVEIDPQKSFLVDGSRCAQRAWTATYPTQVAPSSARVRMNGSGNALVELAAHDVGTGAYTIMGQLAAARLGLPVAAVEVLMGDSNLPLAPISGGSVTSASAGSAVHVACLNLAAEVARTISGMKDNPLSSVDPSKIALDNGELKGPDGQSMKLLDALKATPRGEASAQGDYAHKDLSEDALRKTYHSGFGVAGPVTKSHAMFAFGAEFVEVRVHRWTHEIRVPRMHGTFAAGSILNRKTAHSQLMGGMVWGLGSALMERTEVDHARARFLNTNIAEYLVPVNADVREVRVQMLAEKDDYVNPLGVKGIGEMGIVGTAAAVANAIHHATGKRLRKLPFTIADLY